MIMKSNRWFQGDISVGKWIILKNNRGFLGVSLLENTKTRRTTENIRVLYLLDNINP